MRKCYYWNYGCGKSYNTYKYRRMMKHTIIFSLIVFCFSSVLAFIYKSNIHSKGEELPFDSFENFVKIEKKN